MELIFVQRENELRGCREEVLEASITNYGKQYNPIESRKPSNKVSLET